MTATAEAAAFRSRIQHQRRAASLPHAMYWLTTQQLLCKRALLALLARRADRARDRYEAAAYALACDEQRAGLAYLNRH